MCACAECDQGQEMGHAYGTSLPLESLRSSSNLLPSFIDWSLRHWKDRI